MNIFTLMNDIRLKEEFDRVVLDEVEGTNIYSLHERCEVKHAYWERNNVYITEYKR